MFVYAGNEQALEVAEKMAGWVAGYTGSLSYDHMQRILGTEYGGMGEVFSNYTLLAEKSITCTSRSASIRNGFSIRSQHIATNLRDCTSTRIFAQPDGSRAV